MSVGCARRGALLVVVAGLCSLMAALALAFLVRMRSDGEEGARLAQDIQADVMLSAALMYVQETGRLGWGDETYGWRDVRDGMPGPRGFDGGWTAPLAGRLDDRGRATAGRGAFPAIGGAAARAPMYVMRRPPYAIRATIAPNPVPLTDPSDVAALSLPWDQLINCTNPDPQPVAATWAGFRDGDPAPLGAAGGGSWFRCYRSGVITFVLTCGAGASQGFRDWAEVQATPGADAIFGSREEFEAIRRAESILWYEAEWSELVTGNNFLHGHYARFNQRDIGSCNVNDYAEAPNMRQFGGTISYIQRLDAEPAEW